MITKLIIDRRAIKNNGTFPIKYYISINARVALMSVKEIKDYVVSVVDPSKKIVDKSLLIPVFQNFIESRNRDRTKEIYQGTVDKIKLFCNKYDSLRFEDVDKVWQYYRSASFEGCGGWSH